MKTITINIERVKINNQIRTGNGIDNKMATRNVERIRALISRTPTVGSDSSNLIAVFLKCRLWTQYYWSFFFK